jgi:hypothetical protein
MVIILALLGVEAKASEPLSLIPTPYGVASYKDVLPPGSDLTAFLFSTLGFVLEVYRVLGRHEGSVGSRKV